MLYGPNTNLGGNSIIYMLEGQIGYVTGALRALDEEGLDWIDVRPEVQQAFNAWVKRPAAPRCGRAGATAGTPRPRAATPTTGPTRPSCTGTGSAGSTWPSTGSCRNARPRPAPPRHERPEGRARPPAPGRPRLPPAVTRLGGGSSAAGCSTRTALGGAAPAPGPDRAGLADAAGHDRRRAGWTGCPPRRWRPGPGRSAPSFTSTAAATASVRPHGPGLGRAPERPAAAGRGGGVPARARAPLSGRPRGRPSRAERAADDAAPGRSWCRATRPAGAWRWPSSWPGVTGPEASRRVHPAVAVAGPGGGPPLHPGPGAP